MATVKEVVIPHHQKEDKTWNVEIWVTHGKKSCYINTTHFVVAKQLRGDYSIKDPFIMTAINPMLGEYRTKISDLGEKLNFHSAQSLRDFLVKGELKAEAINFIEFGWSVVKLIETKKRKGCLGNFKAVMYGLQDFFKSENVLITEISSKMLGRYEDHLKTPRVYDFTGRCAVLGVFRHDKFSVFEGGLTNVAAFLFWESEIMA